MTIDFFIHPLCRAGERNDSTANKYKAAVENAFLDSRFPVLITNTFAYEEPMLEFFPTENVLYDSTWGAAASRHIAGEVGLKSWGRLTEILDSHRDEEIRVHGAHFGMEALDFAMQALAYLHNGNHYHDWADPDDFTEDDRDRECISKADHVEKGRLKDSSIRYGHVLVRGVGFHVYAPPRGRLAWLKKLWSMTPCGDANYQLIDEETKVYGKLIIK